MPYDGRWIGDLERPEPPKEGRWIARPKRSLWLPQTFGVVFLLSQLPNWMNQLFGGGHHSPVVRVTILVLMGLLLIPILFSVTRRRLARRVRQGDRALVDGAFGEQFPAEMTIVVGKRPLGTDRGVVWFADGLIGFSGGVASFVLAAWDVQVPRAAEAATRARWSVPSGSLVLVDAPVEAYVVVNPLGDGTKAFRERLHAFEKETAAPDAERHWPPLAPYDEANALAAEDIRLTVRDGR